MGLLRSDGICGSGYETHPISVGPRSVPGPHGRIDDPESPYGRVGWRYVTPSLVLGGGVPTLGRCPPGRVTWFREGVVRVRPFCRCGSSQNVSPLDYPTLHFPVEFLDRRRESVTTTQSTAPEGGPSPWTSRSRYTGRGSRALGPRTPDYCPSRVATDHWSGGLSLFTPAQM